MRYAVHSMDVGRDERRVREVLRKVRRFSRGEERSEVKGAERKKDPEEC